MAPRSNQHHADEIQESWRSLHDYYQSDSGGPRTHYRYRYIVARLIGSPIATQYMITEQFLMRMPHGEYFNYPLSPDDRIRERRILENSPHSYGRGLFFTTAPYGVKLDEDPHVCVFVNADGSQLRAEYCQGMDVIQTHICQPRKEIPCILSLLEQLE